MSDSLEVLNKVKNALRGIANDKIIAKLYHTLQFGFFCYIAFGIIQATVLNKGDARKITNKYCIDHKQDCVDFAAKNVGSYDKFVYMWLDGISWDTAGPIFDVFDKNHTHQYQVLHRALPWSGAVFASYFTGKSAKNMGPVVADNFFHQYLMTNHRIMLGLADSAAYVTYAVRSFAQDDNMVFYPGVNDDNSKTLFEWLFNCDNAGTSTEDCVNKALNRAKSEDRSFFMETYILDHLLHYEVESRFDSLPLGAIKEFASRLQYVKKWIDSNPEYILVLMSDHGGHTPGSSTHGEWTTLSNSAWNLYYNPSLREKKDIPVMHTADVAPTMWQYFAASGVSIPAESDGLLHVANDDLTANIEGLTINAKQMFKYAQYLGVHAHPIVVPRNDDGTDNDSSDEQEYVEHLQKYILDVGEQVQKTNFVFLIVCTLIMTIVQFYHVAKVQFFPFLANVRRYGFLYMTGSYVCWIVFARFMTAWNYMGTANFNMYIFLIVALTAVVIVVVNQKHNVNKNNNTKRGKKGGESYISLVSMDGDTVSVDMGVSTAANANANANTTVSAVSMGSGQDEEDGFWDYAGRCEFRSLLHYVVLYICGLTRVVTNNKRSNNTHFVILFALWFGITFAIMQSLIWQSFLGITDIPYIHDETSVRAGFTFLILLVDCWWQRRLILTALKDEGMRQNSFRNIFLPCFFPMNIKFAIYAVIYTLIFCYDVSVTAGTYSAYTWIPWLVYYVTFAHIFVLLFCPSFLQRDLLHPLFALQLLTNSHYEQLMMCFYILALLPLTNVLINNTVSAASSGHAAAAQRDARARKNVCSDHALSMQQISYVVFLMIVTTHYFYYAINRQSYVFDELNVKVTGIEDTTVYPMLSVALIFFHKLSSFLLLVPFLIRLGVPTLPDIVTFQIWKFTFGYVNADFIRTKSGKDDDSSDEEMCCGDDDVDGTDLISVGATSRYRSKESLCSSCPDDSLGCNRTMIWNVLYFMGLIMVSFFLIYANTEIKNENFMWVLTLIIMVALYGLFIFCSCTLSDLKTLFKVISKKLRTRN